MHPLEIIQHKNAQQVLREHREALAEDTPQGYDRVKAIARANPDLFVGDGRVRSPAPGKCHTAIASPQRFFGMYWWVCTCGDEGGPHENYNEAWDATVDHEKGSR